MILAALALATALDATSAAPTQWAQPRSPVLRLQPTERTPNLYRSPGPACADIERRVVEDQREQLQKLGRLPFGHLEYAVLRSVQGCPVPAPVGYHPPALPGAADAPAMREDAPSNRR
jgi:hypothetical protein